MGLYFSFLLMTANILATIFARNALITETETKLGLSWHQVEEQILAQLEEIGISKDEFHKNFKLDGVPATS